MDADADPRTSREVFLGRRTTALEACACGRIHPGEPHPDIAGLIVDVPAAGGVVSVVALADGTATVLGTMSREHLGEDPSDGMAPATRTLFDLLQRHNDVIRGAPDEGFPPEAHVRFHVIGPEPRAIDLSEAAFWDPAGHPLCELIQAAQDLFVWIRTG